jgi:hypothetical protein
MTNNDAEILRIYERWHATVVGGDLDGLIALYADDAILETPLILATLPDQTEGILKGQAAIRPFFAAGFRKLRNELAHWYRTGTFFSNGRQLTGSIRARRRGAIRSIWSKSWILPAASSPIIGSIGAGSGTGRSWRPPRPALNDSEIREARRSSETSRRSPAVCPRLFERATTPILAFQASPT